jgi:alkanesulfonate monooxygenase SsuD/methylene tetrahydromethanopterin reductase-like flavin-dependent oxidoreductase (luciferase family)
MADVMLRFDMRLPKFATASQADLYQAAIEMCAWGDKNGIGSVHLSEHHGSDDGYCPSPLILASAVAARTTTMRIFISALIAPLHDPVQLAEDLTVLDNISRGRVIPILSGGYRQEEFCAAGKDLKVRKQYMDDIGPFLKKAWSGETFSFEGRTITITPKPFSEPRPMILMGGSSRPAARRAAREADFFIPSGPEIFEYYREELKALGKPDPGPMPSAPSTVTFVATDPDAYWQSIVPHLQHESNTYARWANDAQVFSPYKHFDNCDELRASAAYNVYRPRELIAAARGMVRAQPIMLHPLCGGIHPDLAWQSLELFANEVMPTLREEGTG